MSEERPPLHPNVRRAEISSDVEQYLARGGQIRSIEPGVGGYDNPMRKRIYIERARNAAKYRRKGRAKE